MFNTVSRCKNIVFFLWMLAFTAHKLAFPKHNEKDD